MLVISAKSGQLGNRLLLFANFIAFALEHQLRVCNPAFEEYAEFFQGTARDVLCCYPPLAISVPGNRYLRSQYYKIIRFLARKRICQSQEITRDKPFNWSLYQNIKELKKSLFVCFEGWLFRDGWFVEDTKTLQKYAPQIRAYLTPQRVYQVNVSKAIAGLKIQADILIGVHIRQGDYEQHQQGRYFYPVERYLQVMDMVRQLFPQKRVTFLICSDVKLNSRSFDRYNYHLGNHHLIEDLYALAECDYIIGPPSSYTMWASFYGDKPLYMIREMDREIELKDFVHFYEWRGIFHYRENWNESFWEWNH